MSEGPEGGTFTDAAQYTRTALAMTSDSRPDAPTTFRTTVHGTVFARRTAVLRSATPGDRLVLIPDPPDADEPAVWVHVRGGEPVGHLPPEINAWLAPWMLRGGAASATILRVGGSEVPSWKRLLIEVKVGGERNRS